MYTAVWKKYVKFGYKVFVYSFMRLTNLSILDDIFQLAQTCTLPLIFALCAFDFFQQVSLEKQMRLKIKCG